MRSSRCAFVRVRVCVSECPRLGVCLAALLCRLFCSPILGPLSCLLIPFILFIRFLLGVLGVQVPSDDAVAMAGRLAVEEGLFCGISSGAAVLAAVQVGRWVGWVAGLIGWLGWLGGWVGPRNLASLSPGERGSGHV
jgi:hypothetical protein